MDNKFKKFIATHKIIKVVSLLIILVGLGTVWFYSGRFMNPEIRIGYFHGGRVNMIYRAYIHNYFDDENLKVKLYTTNLRDTKFVEVPKTIEGLKELEDDSPDFVKEFGKMTGTQIIEQIVNKEFDGGTVGESSFVRAINEGLPIVAVAWLGYNRIPGKGFLLRKDIKADSPDDLKGLTFISRRAGPGDAIFLREFINSIGLDPDKDVKIIDQVDDDIAQIWLKEGKIDGGLYHIMSVRGLVNDGTAYVYRPMDWMDPQLSFAVLIFHKDFIQKHGDKVEKFVNAYIKRIKYEKELPDEQKDASWDKGLMMVGHFNEMDIPYYDYPPVIKLDKLYQVQNLLLKYGYINQNVKIEDYINTNFVKEVD